MTAKHRLFRLAALLLGGSGVAAGCSSCSTPDEPLVRADASDAASEDAHEADVKPPPEDAGEDVYGSNWDGGGLATDPSIWSPVPDNRNCGLYVANVVPDPFPSKVWQSCGPGCQFADARIPGLGLAVPGEPETPNGAWWGTATASERNGEIYVRLRYGVRIFPVSGGEDVYLVSRLSDGATIAAAAVRNSDCAGFGGANDAALFFSLSTPGLGLSRGGFIQGVEPGAPVVWGHWLPTAGGYGGSFAIDTGWGWENGTIYLNASPSDTAFQVVEKGTNPYETYGHGKIIAWYEDSRLRAWTAAGGVKTLTTPASGIMWSVALSDQHLVWITVDGYLNTKFTAANLYWSPLASDPSEVKPSGPIPLVGPTMGLVETRTGGDYAVSHGCVETDASPFFLCSLSVAQLSTGKTWVIPPRPGSQYLGPLAVSQDVILVGESNSPGVPADGQIMRRMVRFKTSELDTLAKGW